ncbi:uncharacterized protein LOC129577826 isoform X2 [Sitodiplosis mosellana]|uniref:uncharacterized protein LOC129577826 isoform X2 n=1 Tax=Sitodiplosis mosellana TaxID=263140 RepID=UPI0024445FF2|nr:uncharacterized protein LOC129577826 isoform X2 [Sitodiplosis mosellana]
MSKRCCAEMCFNSQTINKNVSYFGFPKYEEFAVKWANAANRADLLEKKLSCITNIPVPTIFKSNIEKYIPIVKRNASGIESFAEDMERSKRTPNYGPINDFSLMNRSSKEGISMESLSVFHDHYNYPDISGSASFFNDIAVSINDFSNENSFDNIADCPLPDITEEIQHSFLLCRLCAKTFSSGEHLKEFSTEPGIYETLDTILPNQIKSDDNLSQLACTNCLDKLNTCINIINSFKEAQLQIQIGIN